VTTRRPRGDETGGVDYQFVSEEDFSRKVHNGEFAESVRNFDASYGTPRAPLEAAVCEGRDILLDIDIQGAASIRARYPADSVTIFVMPPSFEELEGRLRKRATESEDKIQNRLRRAVEETRECRRFDYVIVNRDIEESLALLESIVNAERARVSRMPEGLAPWNK